MLPAVLVTLFASVSVYVTWIDMMRIYCTLCPVFPAILIAITLLLSRSHSRGYRGVPVIAVAFALPALIQRIFVLNGTLYGYDTIHEFKYFTDLYLHNRMDEFASNYPSIYVLASSFAALTGLPPMEVAKYLPIAITFATNIMAYILFTAVLGVVERGASVSSSSLAFTGFLAFALLYQHVMFHSVLIKETYSFLFFIMAMLAAVKLFVSPSPIQARTMVVVSVLAALSIALSHHLTSFIFMIFVASLAIAYAVWSIPRIGGSGQIIRRAAVPHLIALSAVIVLIKWTYFAVSYSPFMLIKEIIKELSTYMRYTSIQVPISPASSLSLRQEFVLVGEAAFALVAGGVFMILLRHLLAVRRGKEGSGIRGLGFLSTLLLIYAVGIGGLVLITLRTRSLASTFFIRRIQAFVYPLFIPVLITLATALHRHGRAVRASKVVYAALLFYIIVQVVSIQPYLYCNTPVDYVHGETRNYSMVPELGGIHFLIRYADQYFTGPVLTNWYYVAHAVETFSDWRIGASLADLEEGCTWGNYGGTYVMLVNEPPNLPAYRLGNFIVAECGPGNGSSVVFTNTYVTIIKVG